MVSVGAPATATRAALAATRADKVLTRVSSRQVGRARLTADVVGLRRASKRLPENESDASGCVVVLRVQKAVRKGRPRHHDYACICAPPLAEREPVSAEPGGKVRRLG
jgi:hypothetical protein